MSQLPQETFIDQLVNYSVELDGQLIVVEHVPARVCVETGEQLFSPKTTEKLHAIARGRAGSPSRISQTSVFDFAA